MACWGRSGGGNLGADAARAARGIANYGQLTVSDSRIVDNSTTPESGFAGGGILNYGTLTVHRSTIAGNESEVGGGIYGHGGASTTILDSTLSDNFAGDGGGGIYTIGELTIVNSTISGNRAIGDGGGIADFTGDRIALTNVTVVFNQADADGDGAGTGGGLRGSGDALLHNSIVVGNVRGSGNSPSDYAGSIDVSSSFNLFGSLGGFQGGGTEIRRWATCITPPTRVWAHWPTTAGPRRRMPCWVAARRSKPGPACVPSAQPVRRC